MRSVVTTRRSLVVLAGVVLLLASGVSAVTSWRGGGGDGLHPSEVQGYLLEETGISLQIDQSKSDEHVTKLEGEDFSLWVFPEGEDPTDYTIDGDAIPQTRRWTIGSWTAERSSETGFYTVLGAFEKGVVIDLQVDSKRLVIRGEFPPQHFVLPEWFKSVRAELADLTDTKLPYGRLLYCPLGRRCSFTNRLWHWLPERAKA